MDNEKIEWLSKSELLDNWTLKLLYYLGMYEFKDVTKCVKNPSKYISPDKTQERTVFKEYYAWFGPRWWHPLTWAFAVVILIIASVMAICKEVVAAVPRLNKELTVEIHKFKKK